MANQIRFKRASGSDPSASDLAIGEPGLRTDTAELFFKKDDGTIAKVSGGGGGPDFKYLALRNAANNGAASYPNADFTLVTSGTTNAITPAAANTLLVSVNGVIQKPNTGTSTPSSGFALSGSTIKFGTNISAAPDFILYQESGGIGEPSDETVSEAKLKVSNSPVNGYFLSAQSGNTGGLTWAAPVATSCTGNSATATALATARAINGVNFDGTSAITVTAAAGTLSGTTLNSSVVTSSLTSLGDLAGLTVDGDATFTGANYNVLWDKSDNRLEFSDNAKASFGTGNDLQIWHASTYDFIDAQGNAGFFIRGRNNTILQQPQLKIRNDANTEDIAKFIENGSVELYYDNSKKFETTSDGATISGDLTIDGSTPELRMKVTGDTQSHRINFFNAADTIVARIFAEPSGNVSIRNGTNAAEECLKCLQNGAVELYHDNSKKFETGSLGVRFFGDLFADDNEKIKLGNSQDLQIYHSGTVSFIDDLTSGSDGVSIRAKNIRLQTNSHIGAETALNALANGAVELYYDNAKKLETVTGGVTVTGTCTATAFSGDGSALTGISAGATGGGSDEVFYENSTTVTTSYSITSNKNAMSAGPISINNSVTVTVPSGSVWTIV